MQQINNEDYPREEIAKQKITDYTVLYSIESMVYSATSNLKKEVNKYIQCGWQPQGGISITIDGGRCTVCQAMVKREKSGGLL